MKIKNFLNKEMKRENNLLLKWEKLGYIDINHSDLKTKRLKQKMVNTLYQCIEVQGVEELENFKVVNDLYNYIDFEFLIRDLKYRRFDGWQK